ncbi:MAG: hypothetical protein FWG13_03860 [Leptospirales bacterium]|nr:hypothetical protein [Leptospirales bacterium]
MKKFGFWGVFIIIFFAANATVFAYSEKPEYQLLASFAAGYANNKDMNDSADKDVKYIRNAINNYYTTYYGTIYPSKIESSTKANTPVGFDLEFRYFSNNIGFGLQVGYHSAKA